MQVLLLTLVIFLNERIALGEQPIITSVSFNESSIDFLSLTINWSYNSSIKLDRFLVTYYTAYGLKSWSSQGNLCCLFIMLI